jgi:hypothetical protein
MGKAIKKLIKHKKTELLNDIKEKLLAISASTIDRLVFGGPSNGLDTNLKTGLKIGVRTKTSILDVDEGIYGS